jgi:predicted transcriptional regulator
MPKKIQEAKLVGALLIAGLPKNVAKSLVYIIKKGEVKSIEIERETRLRQPEVSIAMQYLRKRGWIAKSDIKKEGKGRPVHSYTLSISTKELISILKKDEEHRIKEIKDNLDKLKILLAS